MRLGSEKNTIDTLICMLTTFLFTSFFVFGTNVLSSYILICSLGMIFLLYSIQNRGLVQFGVERYYIFVLLFSGFCLASALWAENPRDALVKGTTLVEILLFMVLLYIYFDGRGTVRRLIGTVKWASIITTMYTIVYYGIDGIRQTLSAGERLDSAYTNINSVGMLAGIGILIIVYQWLYEGFSLSYAFSIPNIVVVAASGSRKALILVFLGVVLLLMFRISSANLLRNLVKYAAIIVVFVVIFNLLANIPLFYGIMERMEGFLALFTGEGTVDSTSLKRDAFTQIALASFLDAPLFGIGMDNAKYVIEREAGLLVYSHNNFAELLCNGGIVGFLLYYVMYFYCLKNLIRYRRSKDSLTVLCLVLLLVLLVMDWGRVSYYSKPTYFYLMIFFLQVKKLKQGRTDV